MGGCYRRSTDPLSSSFLSRSPPQLKSVLGARRRPSESRADFLPPPVSTRPRRLSFLFPCTAPFFWDSSFSRRAPKGSAPKSCSSVLERRPVVSLLLAVQAIRSSFVTGRQGELPDTEAPLFYIHTFSVSSPPRYQPFFP